MGKRGFKYLWFAMATAAAYVVVKVLFILAVYNVVVRPILYLTYVPGFPVPPSEMLRQKVMSIHTQLLSSVLASAVVAYPKWQRGGHLMFPAIHFAFWLLIYIYREELGSSHFGEYPFILCFFVTPAVFSSMTALMVANRRRKVCLDWKKYDD